MKRQRNKAMIDKKTAQQRNKKQHGNWQKTMQ